ncbi:alpha/beta-hydrolase [Marasmius fiardii PR-910]|nr:alpha/beta-hydrolase [Marasmius fiardii PR-910]
MISEIEKEGAQMPKAVTTRTLQQLVHYLKYATSAYSPLCLRPNGNHLVTHFSNIVSDIQGYVARDDDRKEIIVALRGSTSILHVVLDSQVLLVPFLSLGVDAPAKVRVHSGFLTAWNSVAIQIAAVLKLELSRHRDYDLVTTGHSLGGALSTLAAVALKQTYDNKVQVRNFTYGAPRIGNRHFAEFVNHLLGTDAYRVVHGHDGVPTMIPTPLGYYHHGVEYWQTSNEITNETTLQCSLTDGEDPHCSASIPSEGINKDHTEYFGIFTMSPFCM